MGQPAVLIVDDEPMIVRLLSEILSRAGYPVTSAAGAEEAYTICRQEDALALAIIDCVMPGESGAQLAAGLKQIQPRIGIVLMSGYMGANSRMAPAAHEYAFLQKPFSIESAITVVRNALKKPAAISAAQTSRS